MISSENHEDKANAEACRLGSLAYRSLADRINNIDSEIGSPTYGQRRPQPVDVQSEAILVIEELGKYWSDYISTGIPKDEIKEAVAATQQIHWTKLQEQQAQGSREVLDETGTVPADDTPAGVPVLPPSPPELPKTDPEMIPWIDHRSIEEVIESIREECGLNEQPANV
jgi:hypothetical protein